VSGFAEWFEAFLRGQARAPGAPGMALRGFAERGAGLLFRRAGGAFHVADRAGYDDPEFAYDFLEERPGLLSEAFREGAAPISAARPHRPGCLVWAAVDRPGDPEYMLLAEAPVEAGDIGAVLRQAAVLEAGLRRQRPSPAGDVNRIDLPVWLRDLLPELLERESPLLIMSEAGSGKEELVQAMLRERFGAIDQGVFFHPGRLSQAVQLRELFGDPAGARLGGPSPTVPILERDEAAVVIQEAGDLAAHAQLRILALFTAGESDKFWIFETSRDLERMARVDKFLPGLFQQLRPGSVALPAVRAVKERLPEEVERLLEGFRREFRREMELSPEALEAMLQHDWRGNWRELKNTLESAFLMCQSGRIGREDLRLGLWAQPEDWDELNLRKRSEEMEKGLLLRAYSLHGGNQVQMARALGISRGSLQYKLEKYGLN